MLLTPQYTINKSEAPGLEKEAAKSRFKFRGLGPNKQFYRASRPTIPKFFIPLHSNLTDFTRTPYDIFRRLGNFSGKAGKGTLKWLAKAPAYTTGAVLSINPATAIPIFGAQAIGRWAKKTNIGKKILNSSIVKDLSQKISTKAKPTLDRYLNSKFHNIIGRDYLIKPFMGHFLPTKDSKLLKNFRRTLYRHPIMTGAAAFQAGAMTNALSNKLDQEKQKGAVLPTITESDLRMYNALSEDRYLPGMV